MPGSVCPQLGLRQDSETNAHMRAYVGLQPLDGAMDECQSHTARFLGREYHDGMAHLWLRPRLVLGDCRGKWLTVNGVSEQSFFPDLAYDASVSPDGFI